MNVSTVKGTFCALGLYLCITACFLPAPAQEQLIPRGLPPGLYYYFRPGDDRPTVHYVAGPAQAGGDPFTRPVRPLPIKALENFPLVPFDRLKSYTLADLQKMAGPSRPTSAPTQAYPEPAPEAEMVPIPREPDMQLQRSDLTSPERQAAGSDGRFAQQQSAAPPSSSGQQEGMLDQLENQGQWPGNGAFQAGPLNKAGEQWAAPSMPQGQYGSGGQPQGQYGGAGAMPGGQGQGRAYGQPPWNPATGERTAFAGQGQPSWAAPGGAGQGQFPNYSAAPGGYGQGQLPNYSGGGSQRQPPNYGAAAGGYGQGQYGAAPNGYGQGQYGAPPGGYGQGQYGAAPGGYGQGQHGAAPGGFGQRPAPNYSANAGHTGQGQYYGAAPQGSGQRQPQYYGGSGGPGQGRPPYHGAQSGGRPGQQLAMGPPPSAFQAMPAGADMVATGRIHGVTLEQMEQAAQWARQALKYLHQNKNAEASALLERAAMYDPNPNSNCIHGNLAIAQSRMGNLDRAIKEYGKALQFDPSDRLALLGIATTYQSKGDIPQALAWAHKFVERYPAAPEAADARKMLASLEKASKDLPSDDPNGPDYFESVTKLGVVRWKADRMPLKVFIDQGGGTRGYKRSFRKMLTDSFDSWTAASGGHVSWQQVNDKEQADITCEWTATTEGLKESTGAEGGQTATAMRRNPEGGWSIARAVIKIVTIDMQGRQCTDDDMRTCCLHEVGHAFGLKGHSNNNTDIMFFSESPTNSRALTARDMATLQKLYASAPTEKAMEDSASAPSAE